MDIFSSPLHPKSSKEAVTAELTIASSSQVSASSSDSFATSKKVDEILTKRREMLPVIEQESSKLRDSLDMLNTFKSNLQELAECESDAINKSKLRIATNTAAAQITFIVERISSLESLKAEFSRETLNLGVSGEARVGKSTTLQRFTGLSDIQIPTGNGLPVTAVRSEIYNDARNCAEITFYTESEFMRNFVAPHLNNVSKAYGLNLSIQDLNSLRRANLNIALGSGATTVATNSLDALQSAQKDIDSYIDLLGSGKKSIPLDQIRQYVAYPTDSEIQAAGSRHGKKPVNRKYLAVKDIKIFCEFPGLKGVKVGVVDLPGLGEIGANVAASHLHGLESQVDQIVLIAKPTKQEGYFKKGISENIDNLKDVQAGVTHRNDLLSLAVNVEVGAEDSARSLQHDIDQKLNSHLNPEERYQIFEYNATNAESTTELFDWLLNKLVKRLPEMDAQKLEFALRSDADDAAFERQLKDIQLLLSSMKRAMPNAITVEYKRCQSVSAKIIEAYNTQEVALLSVADSESEAYKEFCDDVDRIYNQVEANIRAGFFRGSVNNWEASAQGKSDYYNFYRDECKRIRSCIVDAYCGLDLFYGDHVERFKHDTLDVLLTAAGSLYKAFAFDEAETEDEKIDIVSQGLSSRISCENTLGALSLLRDTDFGFRSNVFLLIEKHLEELQNPSESFTNQYGTKTSKSRSLGSVRSSADKMKSLSGYLAHDALAANEAIKEALLHNEDCFNRYLFNSLSFFCDHLYRRDVESFKGIFVRGLVTEFQEELFPGQGALGIDPRKVELLENLQGAANTLLPTSSSSKAWC